MEKIVKNINNLNLLWEAAGSAFDTLQQQGLLTSAYVPDVEWPNRI